MTNQHLKLHILYNYTSGFLWNEKTQTKHEHPLYRYNYGVHLQLAGSVLCRFPVGITDSQ